MDPNKPRNGTAGTGAGAAPPISEADLHAYVDRQLSPQRAAQVEEFLSAHPEAQACVRDWQRQNGLLHQLLDPVAQEPLPLDLQLRAGAFAWPWRAMAAGLLVAVTSGGAAWSVRGHVDAERMRVALATLSAPASDAVIGAPSETTALTGFARRAAIAHVVYSPEVRRPVEVGADQEQALVTWLTKRMGTAVRPPALGPLGYELIGGRLLPGDKGPVAQFMYGGADGQRLTLYVTREVANNTNTSFAFGQDGPVNVFYWVENHLGYAISAGSDRAELLRVSQEVYRQLR